MGDREGLPACLSRLGIKVDSLQVAPKIPVGIGDAFPIMRDGKRINISGWQVHWLRFSKDLSRYLVDRHSPQACRTPSIAEEVEIVAIR